MQISYNWLQNYLPATIPLDELSNILTSIGLEVEGIDKSESVPGGLEGLVIGRVETCEQHPNADKLKITTVDIGRPELLNIVCGAPNVAAGQKVLVAPSGTTVHPVSGAPFPIKKSKIRGVASEGMICAEDEVGLGTNHDGILVLDEQATVGMAARNYFNMPEPDYTIHIGLTPNRSDSNSHIGVARDVCAYMAHHAAGGDTSWAVKLPETELVPPTEEALPVDITVDDHQGCPRYAGLTIKGVRVAPSPEWLVSALQAIGVRSVNNIVDITNYILHEYGQPLHAFDYDKIHQHHIIVRYPEEGKKFISLDEKERTLQKTDLMICDASHELCIAGVFGGIGSGVTGATQNIFLESAYFNPKSIRKTSLHHGLRTDAATHFEKGVDINMVVPALIRAANLITLLAGGQIASAIKDIYPSPWAAPVIKFAYSYINRLCGKAYKTEDVDNILSSLGFQITGKTGEELEVIVPGNKPDIRQPADIVEEILRIDGLDNIPIPDRLNIHPDSRPLSTLRKWQQHIAAGLTQAGLQEIITNSITNSKYYPEHPDLVRMLNSLSSELDIMRPEMLESGLEVIAYNINRKQQDLQLYEFGHVYHTESKDGYKQTALLSLWLTGNVKQQHWQYAAAPADIYYIKGLLHYIFTLCGIGRLQETVSGDELLWNRGKQNIAKAIKVPESTRKTFDIKQDVFYAEVNVKALADAARSSTKYTELPKYPFVKRDLALVLNKDIPYSKVEAIVHKQKWDALKNYELFDVFENEKLGTGKKSMALSFTFQLNDRTLTDEEVEGMMSRLITVYQDELQAQVRG